MTCCVKAEGYRDFPGGVGEVLDEGERGGEGVVEDRVGRRDCLGAGEALEEVGPGRGQVVPEGGYDTCASDYDSFHVVYWIIKQKELF